LIARVLPVISNLHFISAGIFKVSFGQIFRLYFFGSLIWSYVLAYIGLYFGEQWQIIEIISPIDYII